MKKVIVILLTAQMMETNDRRAAHPKAGTPSQGPQIKRKKGKIKKW